MPSARGYGARHRQSRMRVVEALELLIKQFLRREDLWPLRVPREPLLLESVISRVLGEDAAPVAAADLRSRPLLRLEWEDGSAWAAWVIVLPSGFKVYCDSTPDEDRILASGGRNEGDDSDRAFLQLLAESAGQHFGIEMSGGAPSRVRAAIGEREFLIDLFVDLFEVAGSEDSVREQLAADPGDGHPSRGSDFREEVERWLDQALTSSPAS